MKINFKFTSNLQHYRKKLKNSNLLKWEVSTNPIKKRIQKQKPSKNRTKNNIKELMQKKGK